MYCIVYQLTNELSIVVLSNIMDGRRWENFQNIIFFWWQSYWIWIKLWRVFVSIMELVQIDEIISFIIRSRVIMLQKEASAPIRREDFGPQAVRPFLQHSSSFVSNIPHLSVPTRRIVSALRREELLPQAVLLSRKETQLTIIDNKEVDSLPFFLSR